MKQPLLISLLLALPITGLAAIYKFYDENGELVFSDQPGPNAEKLDLEPISTIKPRIVKLPKANNQTQGTSLYETFTFANPTQGETLRENNGSINVDLLLNPPLDGNLGHLVELKLDGKAVSDPVSSMAFTLNNVDRGSHTLTASVIDRDQKVIAQTETITVHLKRNSVLLPKPNTKNQTPQPAKSTPAPTSNSTRPGS